MNTSRIVALAATLSAGKTAASAQTPTHPETPGPVVEFGPPVMDQGIFAHGILNENEGRANGVDIQYRWEGQGWVGTDYDKLWIKSEGIVQGRKVEDGQQEFLYARAITTYFNLQGGLRSDLDSRPTRNWASFGIEGLAPYFFELGAAGYVSSQGHLAARFEASYDLLLTQRLILQPQVELNFYSKSDPAREIGAGLSEIDAGLRLRYELTRKFAPYIGIAYEGKFGQTANFAKREGETRQDLRFAFGVRVWF